MLGIDSMVTLRAHTLLLLAPVRRRSGDLPGARALVEEARELIDRFADPGASQAPAADRAGAGGGAPPAAGGGRAAHRAGLAVLRLLSTRLSNREIGGQLYVSVNTVRTHLQAIYHKLGVATGPRPSPRRTELGLLLGRRIPARMAEAPPAATSNSWPGRCGWPAT